MRFLGTDVVTGSTGYYKSFAVDTLTGATGHLRFLGADVVTGSTGYYTSFAVDTFKGGSGHFRFLGADVVTGSTGYYKSFAIDTLTGGTGYFTNVVTAKIGVNAGMTGQNINAVAIGTNAGQYNQGTSSIAIGYMAGPTSMTQNSIALNASGIPIYATGPTGGFFVAPIASYTDSTGPFTVLAYGGDNQVVQYTKAVTSSTPTVTYDSWSLSNLVNAPPGVRLTIDNYTTTDVYIVFDYPQQVSTAFGLMPMISSMYVNMSAGLTGETGTSVFTIPNTTTTYNVTGTNYLDVESTNGTGSFFISTNTAGPTGIVQCINITKSARKTGLLSNYTITNTTEQSLKTTGTTIPCYTINYSALANGSPASFYLWYGNGNPSVNVSNSQFQYKAPQNPTPISFFTITSNNTTNAISFGFTGSTSIDAGDKLSTANLCYNVYYQPVSGSNRFRYGGTVDTTQRFFTSYVTGSTGGNISSIITSGVGSNVIYPDTSYILTVNASNTTLGTGTFIGTTGLSIQGTTGPSLPTPQINESTSVPLLNLISGRSISGGTVTNLLPTTTIPPSFNKTFAIQNTMSTRGSTGASLVSFTSSLRGGADLVGPSMSLNGFSGSYNYTPVTLNGITIIPSQPVDRYPAGPAGWTGYYLQNTIRVGITGSILASNSNQYTLSVTGTYPSTNSGVNCNFFTSFYYDGEPRVPLITTTPQISLVSSSIGYVCGVAVINTSSVFSLTTSGVTGIGNYFYNSNANGIISYTQNGPAGTILPNRETTLSNLTSGTGAAGFNNPVSFTNTSITFSNNVSNAYIGPVGINVVPYNTWGTGGSSVSSNTINCIFDPVSLLKISQMTPTSANGIRVFSTRNAANMAVASYDSTKTAATAGGLVNNNIKNILYDSSDNNIAGTPYISTIYDNIESIGSGGAIQYSQDAMLYNGVYGAGYQNYNIYYYGPNQLNNVNYTSIGSGTRYVTFAYDVTNVTLPFQNIAFTINGLINVNYFGVSPNGTLYYGASPVTPLVFFYRLEDSTSSATAINWSTGGQISTPWINGNLIPSGTQSLPTSVNFSNIYFTPAGLTTATYNSISKTAILNCVLGNRISSSNKSGKMTLYCRIGLQNGVTFTGITYSLS